MFCISRFSCLLLLILVPTGIFGETHVTAQSSIEQKAKLHILAIGITSYEHYKAKEVPAFAAKDASDFTTALAALARGSFDAVETHVLLNGDATRASIAKKVEELQASVKPQDSLVFFYSGHGISRTLGIAKEQQFYLVPHNFDPSLERSEMFDRAISSVLLQSWLLSIRAKHQFIVLNSDKSGHGFEEFVARAEEDKKFLGTVARRDLAVLFNNAGSYELNKFENGLLPYLLIDALKSDVLMADGVVTAKELLDYVVKNATEVIRRSGNTLTQRALARLSNAGKPASYMNGEDFPLGSRSASPQPNNRLANHASAIRSGATQSISENDDTEFIMPPECATLSEVRAAKGSYRNGKDHALLFGTDLYDNWTTLSNPTVDATAIAEILNTRFGFATEVVKNANKLCVGLFLAKYSVRKYERDEQLLIFFAGHGSYTSNLDGFLITRDSKARNVDLFGFSSIPHSLLARIIDGIPCEHIFLVLDSCFGGAMATAVAPQDGQNSSSSSTVSGDSGDAAPYPNSEMIKELMQFKTRRFLTSGGLEYVSDGTPGNHSPFANKFLSAFATTALNTTFFTVSEMIPKVKFAPPYQPIILYDAWPSNKIRSEFFFFILPT